MSLASVYNSEGSETEKKELKKELFGIKPNSYAVQLYVKAYLSNQRQGTVSTLTRATMSGGGAKPWRQKGTGRARAGSNTSPLWVGGGRAFGPHPRDWSLKIPHKIKRLALKSVFSDKAKEDRIKIIESINLEAPKTKVMADFFNKIGLQKRKCLFLVEEKDDNLYKSCLNLANLTYKRASLVNTYDIIANEYIVMTKKALETLEEVFAG